MNYNYKNKNLKTFDIFTITWIPYNLNSSILKVV